MANRKLLVMDDDDHTTQRWIPISEALDGYVETDPDPPVDPNILFLEEWKSGLSIQDGQLPKKEGVLYDDSFRKWKSRNLPKNQDLAWKRYVPGVTHDIIDGGILALRVNKANTVQAPTGYLGGMLSTEPSFRFLYGKVTVRKRFPAYGPGMHWTTWLMPDDGSTDMEYDILERIGNNQWAPEGPINSMFFNAKNNKGSSAWLEKSVRPEFFKEWHDYAFIWSPTELVWLVDDVQVHRTDKIDLIYKKPMVLYLTHEAGASPNGEFPGPIKPSTPWPVEVQVAFIKVEKLNAA